VAVDLAVALVLVRLKLALLRAGLRAAGVGGVLATIFAVAVALSVGVFGAVSFGVVRLLSDQHAMEASVGGFGLVLLVWMLGPIVTATSEGTLEADRLVVFPLTPRQLMPGLLGAALAGFGALATVVTFAGAFVGLAPVSPLALLTALAILLELATCATFGRLLGTVVSGAARSRRWRDVALVAGPVAAISVNLLMQLALRRTAASGGGQAGLEDNPLARALLLMARLLPSGPAAMAAGFARAGRALPAIAALVAAGLVVFAGLALWHAALERTLSSAGSSGGPARRRGRGGVTRPPRDLTPALFAPFLPETRVGAVAARELRFMSRDPRQRVAMISSLFVIVLPLVSIQNITFRSAAAVLFAAMPAYSVTLTATNLFGYDGTAHWMNVAAADDVRSDLLGKWLARIVLVVPLVLAVSALLVARTGSAAYLAPAWGLAVAAAGLALGLGSILSVRMPFPMPASRTNVFSSGTAGRGASAGLAAMAVFVGQGIVLGPLVAAALLLDGVAARALVTAAAVAAGVAGALLGLRSAVRWSGPRQPELLVALAPRQA
jgi:ABC-2 type transport system permease protein